MGCENLKWIQLPKDRNSEATSAEHNNVLSIICHVHTVDVSVRHHRGS